MQNDENRPHRRSFIRKLRRLSENRQRDLHEKYRTDQIYVDGREENVADFINSLRSGNEALVATLAVLARGRDALRQAIKEIRARDCVIVEITTGRRSDGKADVWEDAIFEAAKTIAGDARPAKAKYSEWGAEGGKKAAKAKIASKKTTVEEARQIWFDVRVKDYAAAEEKSGWAARTMHRRFGARDPSAKFRGGRRKAEVAPKPKRKTTARKRKGK